ncbi:MAG: neutral zinc metallopeptidase [Alphaproteobacteria bacterium]
MKWRGRRQSTNIEDRRGARRSPGRMRLPMGSGRRGKSAGIGGLGLIVVIVVAMLFGVDPSMLLSGLQDPSGQQASQTSPPRAPGTDNERDFAAVVLADTEEIWGKVFSDQLGQSYREPTLVLFSDAVRSACGQASSAVGPFYCPGDNKVYLDLTFFQTLSQRFGASGDFAAAYVIAHEVGHHVQTLLGISRQVHAARSRVSETEGNALSVRQELQADCFAGLWAHQTQRLNNVLEEGDIDEALRAANAIGDDTLQRQARGTVVPDSFTHGTSEQRKRWFMQGWQTGRVDSCDTFSATSL